MELIEQVGEGEALSRLGDRFAQGLGRSEETGFNWNNLERWSVWYVNTDNYGQVHLFMHFYVKCSNITQLCLCTETSF